MKLSWPIILGGLVLSIIAGLIVQWIDQKINGAQTSAQAAWQMQICAPTLPNLNTQPQNAASAYQTGAPVTNYRSFIRVGSMQVPV
jgi:hypothetical protein